MIVKPAIVTLRPEVVTSKTRLEPPPLIVSSSAPGPSISRLVLIASSPLVKTIVLPSSLLAKLIVSPLAAVAMAAQRARTAVVIVCNRERGEEGAVFHEIEIGPEAHAR